MPRAGSKADRASWSWFAGSVRWTGPVRSMRWMRSNQSTHLTRWLRWMCSSLPIRWIPSVPQWRQDNAIESDDSARKPPGSRVRGHPGLKFVPSSTCKPSILKPSILKPSIIPSLIVASLVLMAFSPARANEAIPEAADPALEARMVHVTSELRCLVCQNQTIADSHADLAVDLRNQVREQLQAGRSDAEIVAYMTARYGDFVLYRPPFKAITILLWLGPALMLGGGLAALGLVLRRRSRLPQQAFESDDDTDDEPADAGALASSHGA